MTQADNAELLDATLARIERGDDPFDTQGRAAFDYVRKFISEHAPDGFPEMMDREAMALVGEPEEKVSDAMHKLATEAYATFGAMPMQDADRGGPNFRGLREAMRLARELYRAGKEFVDEMEPDEEK